MTATMRVLAVIVLYSVSFLSRISSTSIRLVNGPNSSEGRLEVYHDGKWGTVCDDDFDEMDAFVVCRMLSHRVIGLKPSYYGSARYGQGTGPILLDDVNCNGHESDIANCRHRGWGVNDCGHSEDVAVKCSHLPASSIIRLVGGNNPMEGRVQLKILMEWGSICSQGFDNVDAEIICKTLLTSRNASIISDGRYGHGNEGISLSNVACRGNEADLSYCPAKISNSSCPHMQDVAIRCGEDTPIRLVGGKAPFEGRLEVQHNGQWGTVCDDSFSVNDAKVVCRYLGFNFTAPVVYSLAHFGQGNGSILMDDVSCTGNEADLSQCGFPGWGINDCAHTEDVSVRCYAERTPIRLLDGNTLFEGRVEVQHNGQWGTVCDDAFDVNDAKVVCKSLGFNHITPVVYSSAHFGQGSGTIFMDNVNCTGHENDISHCHFLGWGINNCGHGEDVSVKCDVGATPIRLVGGNTPLEGRLEVQHNGHWGTVCDDLFDVNDAMVVCRSLNFYNITPVVYSSAHFGQGSGTIFMDDVDCTGHENDISHCHFLGWGKNDCSHGEDVSVKCDVATDFSAKLSQKPWIGLLQVFGGSYVCDDDFTKNNADCICRYLGYNVSESYGSRGYGTAGSLGPWSFLHSPFKYTESSYAQCGIHKQNNIEEICVKTEAIGITCARTKIRLVDGSFPWEGRVEIYHDNRWGTICGSGFDRDDARVICRMLGFPEGYETYSTNSFNQGTGHIWISNLQCNGDENDISSCRSNVWGVSTCSHGSDIGIVCLHTKMRLVNGTEPFEGRVEVYNTSNWHSVYLSVSGSNVYPIICSTLGYNSSFITGQSLANKYFGIGSHGTLYTRGNCDGEELDIAGCMRNYPDTWKPYSSHSYDMSIRCIFKNVRLVNGPHRSTGRVEIYRGNKWGTVCRKNFTDRLATGICKMIADRKQRNVTGKVLGHLFYGKGNGHIWKIRSGCSDVAKCLLPEGDYNDCSHDDDVSIRCSDDTEVRLMGGRTAAEGTVQLKHQNHWGTLCDNSWDLSDARVICNQLGYWSNSPTVYRNSWFGAISGRTWKIYPNCGNTYGTIGFCGFSYDYNYMNCSLSDEAGVRCIHTAIGTNNVKLVSGPGPWKGRLDVKINYNYGGICSNGWTNENTRVVCEMLQFRSTNAIHSVTKRTDFPLFLSNVKCVGNESDIGMCKGSFDISNCSDNAVEIDCSGGMKVRLVNGSNYLEGRVEVYVDGTWKTICDRGWDSNDGKAICEMLGLPNSSPTMYYNAYYGRGSGEIAFQNINCNGNEHHIGQCSRNSGRTCSHSDDAGIRCASCVKEFVTTMGQLQSTNYPHSYDKTDCVYKVRPPVTGIGYILTVEDIYLRCCTDFVEISEDTSNRHLVKLVSSHKPAFLLTGQGFTIRFKTQSSASYKGFGLSWRPLEIEDTIQVGCGTSTWDIAVNMTILRQIHNDSSPNLMFLNNPTCLGKYRGELLTFNYEYKGCNTHRKIQSGEYIYSNSLKYPEATSPLPQIIRNYRWIEDVSCHITQIDSGSIHIHPQEIGASTASPNVNHHGTIGGSGQAGVKIEMFRDKNFNEEISNSNIGIGQNVYVKVTSGSTDSNTKMRLHSCTASPYSYSSNYQYTLIRDGCAVDSTTHIISQERHESRFVFETFEFPTSVGNVYVKCNATLCENYSNTPECAQSCHTSNTRRVQIQELHRNTSYGTSEVLHVLSSKLIEGNNVADHFYNGSDTFFHSRIYSSV